EALRGPAGVAAPTEHLLRGHHHARRLAPANPDLGGHRRRARPHQQRPGLPEGQERGARPARGRGRLGPRRPPPLLPGARAGGVGHRGGRGRSHRGALREVLGGALPLVRGARAGAGDHRHRAREDQRHGL
ncbi:MAG: Putative oxidoreductase, partial [uncultured Rubrobacteraceae bacterium]